jgi:hypothetical protein
MGKFKLRYPSTGTVLGFIAIVIAVVGTASAAPSSRQIHADEIAPGAVTARALGKGVVHAKNLANSAVSAKKIGKGAVNKRVLAKGAVTSAAIADNAITARQLAPGSVYGGALGERTVHTTPIADIDQVAENGTWTAGNTEAALCGPGEKLLSAFYGLTELGNREVTFLKMLPVVGVSEGVIGQMGSNSGGTAKGEIIAYCLK